MRFKLTAIEAQFLIFQQHIFRVNLCNDTNPYSSFPLFFISPGNNLILPPGLSLNGCNILASGSQHKIREACSMIEELDLADNSFTDLSEVYKIVSCMPCLRFLNLSQNDFSAVSSSDVEKLNTESRQLESMKSLVLNNTRVPWVAVNHLLESMPNLNELHLSLNNYTSMEMDSKARCYPNITRLYISGNPDLSSFDEVSNLVSSFPCLEGLTMADCNVSSIPESFESLVPHLQSLNITNWPIGEFIFKISVDNFEVTLVLLVIDYPSKALHTIAVTQLWF